MQPIQPSTSKFEHVRFNTTNRKVSQSASTQRSQVYRQNAALHQRVYNAVIRTILYFSTEITKIFNKWFGKKVTTASQGEYLVSYNLSKYDTYFTDGQQKPYFILSVKGGGVRGIVVLEVLKLIFEKLNAEPQELFDGFAGTSAGSIIVSALTKRKDGTNTTEYTLAKVHDLFLSLLDRAFSRTLWHRFSTLFGLIGPKYPSVKPLLKELIGETPLHDALADSILITAFDTKKCMPILFHSKHDTDTVSTMTKKHHIHATLVSNDGIGLADAVTASCSAPYYFPSDEQGRVDGGIAANDPSNLAALTALEKLKNDPKRPIFILSLGTGVSRDQYEDKSGIKNWGVLQWVLPLVGYITSINSTLAHEQLKRLSEIDNRINYFDFTPLLGDDINDDLDCTDITNVEKLQTAARESFTHFLENFGEKRFFDPLQRCIQQRKK